MRYIKTYEKITDSIGVSWNKVLHNATWTHKKISKNEWFMDFDKIKLAIENGADVEFCQTLSWAVRMNNFEVVKYMLEHGANVNYQDNDCKWSPLMTAANDGYVEIAKLLIDYNADPFLGNFQGYTTMDVVEEESPVSDASFGYKQSEKMRRNRDEIRKYIEGSDIVAAKKYNL